MNDELFEDVEYDESEDCENDAYLDGMRAFLYGSNGFNPYETALEREAFQEGYNDARREQKQYLHD